MSGALPMRRRIRLVAISAMLIAVASASLVAYKFVIHRFEVGGPVDQWLEIALERRHLEGLNAAAVLIEPERYESELERLSQVEQSVVSSSDFPADTQALNAYLQARETLPRMPNFLLVFIISSITFAAAVSWLRGLADGIAIAERGTNSTSETKEA